MASLVKQEKKRGRPPKNQVIQKPIIKTTEKPYQEEQLVLFLESFDDSPDSCDNNAESETTKTAKTTKTTKTTKSGNIYGKTSIRDNLKAAFTNESENNFESNSDESDEVDNDIDKSSRFKHLTETNKNLNSNSNYNSNSNSDSDSDPDINNSDFSKINIDKLLDEIKKRDMIISTLKSRVNKNNICENHVSMTKDNKKRMLNLGLIQINKNKPVVCDKTDIACWWCTYNFDTLPLFLPDQYRNSIYYVFGNFCSFSCMLAYNQNLDDYRKSVRNGLIKQLYYDIFKNSNSNLKAAGPKELLNKYGGPMDIAQFRDINYMCNKQMKMTLPPMIPLISELEEIEIEN